MTVHRPFAEVCIDEHGDAYLFIAGFCDGTTGQLHVLEARAASLNTVAGQHEAELRGAIQAAAQRDYDRWSGDGGDDRPGNLVCEEIIHRIGTYAAAPDAPEYVSGDIACGLAFDLGGAQAKLEGSWGVLLDFMLERGGESGMAAMKLGEQLGLMRVTRGLGAYSDIEFLVELAKRGYVGALDERPVELRLTEEEILDLMRLEPTVPPYVRTYVTAS